MGFPIIVVDQEQVNRPQWKLSLDNMNVLFLYPVRGDLSVVDIAVYLIHNQILFVARG